MWETLVFKGYIAFAGISSVINNFIVKPNKLLLVVNFSAKSKDFLLI